MADNNETTSQTPAITTDQVRAIVEEVLAGRDYVTSAQVTALLEKQTDTFQSGLGSLRTELLDSLKALKGDVSDELKSWRNIIKAQDLAVRNAEDQTRRYSELASEIKGQNTAITETLTRFSHRLDTITEDVDNNLKESITRIEAKLAEYTAVVRTEIDTRITPIEADVARWKARDARIVQAVKFVLTSRKWLAVIGGGGTATALLLELIKALGGG